MNMPTVTWRSWKLKAEHLERENERLRAELEAWYECAVYDPTIPKPTFKSWNRSALDRCRRRYMEKSI